MARRSNWQFGTEAMSTGGIMLDRVLDRVATAGLSRPTFHPPYAVPKRTASVSVVVPCYNYGHYLQACVGSILSQPHIDAEVIIVDDASPDGSVAVAHQLAAADSRVRVIAHPVNKGHIATYNDGLAAANGEFVVLLSADDLLAPGGLTRAVTLLVERPELGLVYGFGRPFSDQPPPTEATEARAWATWPGLRWLRDRCTTGRNALSSPEAVMRTDVLRTVGGYNPDLPHSGDLEMWMRASAVADVGFVAGVDQAYYRVHGANMHFSEFQAAETIGRVVDLKERRTCFEAVLGAGSSVPDAEELLALARRALAREALVLAIRSFVWRTADSWPVNALAEFAEETCPREQLAPLWRALELRRRVGSRRARRNPAFYPTEAIHKAQSKMEQWRFIRLGI
jgi:hypothetical protein